MESTENLITGIADLEKRIMLLKQREKELQLGIKNTYTSIANSLQPGSILKMAFHTASNTPGLKAGMVESAISVVAGFVGKKVIKGKNPGLMRKVLGLASQILITTFVKNKLPKAETESADDSA